MTEKTISKFHTSFYIPAIQKLEFHITHVQIMVTNHCGNHFRTAFKRHKSFQDVLCRRDYDERLVAIFDQKIQSEYCGGNISVSIEGIALEHFSDLPETGMNPSKKSCPLHAVFRFFLDDSKQDSDTTTSHSKRFIELLKERKLLTSSLSTIWKNTNGCATQYTCVSALYLMSVMS